MNEGRLFSEWIVQWRHIPRHLHCCSWKNQQSNDRCLNRCWSMRWACNWSLLAATNKDLCFSAEGLQSTTHSCLMTAGTCRPDGMAIAIVRSTTATERFNMMPPVLEEHYNHEGKLKQSSQKRTKLRNQGHKNGRISGTRFHDDRIRIKWWLRTGHQCCMNDTKNVRHWHQKICLRRN